MAQELNLEAIESRLRMRLSEVDAEIAELTKPPERGGTIAFGKRVGEGTTQAIGRFTDVGIANDLQGIKERIERALEKLDEGTYGTCDNCGKPIIEGRATRLRKARSASSAREVLADLSSLNPNCGNPHPQYGCEADQFAFGPLGRPAPAGLRPLDHVVG